MITVNVDATDESSDWIHENRGKKSDIKKFEIPDAVLEAAGIDPSKMDPKQLMAMFAELAKKGLLDTKPKSGGKKSPDKKTGTEGSKETKKSGKQGLVKKKVTVRRGGKTFEQERWVKAGEDVSEEKPKKGEEKPEEKPKGKPEEKPEEKPESKPEGKPEEKPSEMPEPEKPKGPVIQGLNKPEGEDSDDESKDDDFASDLNVDDWVMVGGRPIKVVSIDKKNKKVTLGAKGSFIPDEEYDFDRLNEIGSPGIFGKN